MKRTSIGFIGLLVFGLLLSANSLSAATYSSIKNEIDNIIAGSYSGITWAVLIENDEGTMTYYNKNGDLPMRPASNTKIFTTAGAFEIKGASYVWNGYQLGSSSTSSPVHSILNNSDNTLADSLYSHVGGTTPIFNALENVGIDMGSALMYDGSGLSYSNRFTPRQTLETVRYMRDNYTYGQWASHLAIGCQSGTLSSRFCGGVGSGNVHAKTGTLTNGQTLSLSGYIANPNDGKRYYFSIYCNGVPSTYQSGTRARIDDIVEVMGQSGIPNPGSSGIIVDNTSSGFSASGNWFNSTSAWGYWGSNYKARATESVSDTATWSASLANAGDYEVFARWTASTNRATSAAYIVYHNGGSTTVNVNQQANSGTWVKLGTFEMPSGSATRVALSCWTSSGDYVIADAVQLVYAGPSEVIVDNGSSNFTASTSWFPSSYVSGYYGADYHARATESVSDAAAWNVNLPVSGNWKVYARWTTGSNRATSAPYIIYHNSGTTTVNVNQQQNNGSWQYLGTFNFNSGASDKIILSCWTSSGDFVIADAVKFVLE